MKIYICDICFDCFDLRDQMDIDFLSMAQGKTDSLKYLYMYRSWKLNQKWTWRDFQVRDTREIAWPLQDVQQTTEKSTDHRWHLVNQKQDNENEEKIIEGQVHWDQASSIARDQISN